MNPLQIHILAGPQAGARLQLNQSPVTFGRSGDCTLILDLPVVSRLHGELQIDEQGQWVLVNHSSNGTRVGRKKATKKPIPLSDGVSINIGDTEVFRIHLTPVSAEDAQDADPGQAAQPATAAPGAGMKGRSKLWIGLGIWFGLCIAAMLFFATLGGGDGPSTNTSAGFYYPGKEVEDQVGDDAGITAIRRLLAEPPAYEDPNESRYSEAIDRATRAAGQGTGELYTAYDAYQTAIRYSDNRTGQPFKDPADVTRYDRILNDLSVIIYTQYIEAFRRYKSNDYQGARDILERLRMRYYNEIDTEDKLANHIRKLYNAAHRRAK
ncbi:MAG: FHA domain-containing protein [Phycisphaeraceae bacterium]